MNRPLRLSAVALAAAFLVAGAQWTAFAASSSANMTAAPQEAEVTVLSPAPGDHLPGAGWDLQIQVVVPAAYAAQVPATPALTPPSSPYFKPGPSHAFPGLVVTDTGTAAALGGPAENLAGLFQVVGVQKNFAGDTVIEADWLVGKPLFASVPMPCIRAYVVSGTAPAKVAVPPTDQDLGRLVGGHTLISNVARVDVAATPPTRGM